VAALTFEAVHVMAWALQAMQPAQAVLVQAEPLARFSQAGSGVASSAVSELLADDSTKGSGALDMQPEMVSSSAALDMQPEMVSSAGGAR
jgi:hypothetical protein